ncbi:MAG: hypothetical protein LC648_03100 [Novosphingobium sp.]|nr:hypothetical protein [Novosphingobium sp.]
MYSASTSTARMLLAAAAGCGLLAASAAQAQSIVVRSSGPSATAYPQGKKLPANARVTLKAGDKLTVLDKAGSRILSGPGSFTLDGTVARDAGAAARVAGVMGGGAARTRTGAVRGAAPASPATAAGPAAPDSVWYIDVSKGGAYCVTDPGSLVLWRPNRAEEATGKLSLVGGKPVEVTWKKGNPLRLWPTKDLPVVDATRYTFSDPVGPNVPITLHIVGPPPNDDFAVASLLAHRGCLAQLEVFANAATAATAGG